MRTYVNLLDNAIKYSPEGSVIVVACTILDGGDHQASRALVPEEAISSLESGRHYVLTSISDQGIGIPPECHNLIFDKFFPINNRKRTERKGVGLGLAFCKQVIEAHGGRIWLQSPIEKDGNGGDCGCRFSFVLPAHEETVQQ
jgi:signal transduction histidine kinase